MNLIPLEDNFKKVLCHLDMEDIEEILNEFEFPKSKKKDDLIEIILKNATVFEYAVDYLFRESNISEIRILCDDLDIDSKKIIRSELEKKILHKLNKNIENRNIENKINFLSSPSAFRMDELQNILADHGMYGTGKKEKLVEKVARNDFLVIRSIIEWKKELQKEDIKKMCKSLDIDSKGNRGNLLQRINDHVFKNEVKKDVQKELTINNTNSTKNIGEIHSGLSLTPNPKLVNHIIEEIKSYAPPREKLGLEYNYQLGLHGWLSRSFNQAEIEQQRGNARPDIVIDNVAIEIKGPTFKRDLVTIAHKINVYPQYFEKLIIVLFEIEVLPEYLNEWKKSTFRHQAVRDEVELIIK